MKLKTLIATSAVAVAVASSAMAAHECGHFTGFDLGVNLGYGAGTNNARTTAGTTSSTSTLGQKGVVGGFQAGYTKEFGQFVAGLEASFNLSNTEGKNTESAGVRSTAKRTHAFGAAANLGMKINSWLAYVKLGWENASFKYNNTGTTAAASFNKKKRHNGFVSGFGVATMLTHNLKFGVEWTYTFYNKASITAPNGEKSSFTPRIGDFKLKLGYKF